MNTDYHQSSGKKKALIFGFLAGVMTILAARMIIMH